MPKAASQHSRRLADERCERKEVVVAEEDALGPPTPDAANRSPGERSFLLE
jgi:hypothetical protein